MDHIIEKIVFDYHMNDRTMHGEWQSRYAWAWNAPAVSGYSRRGKAERTSYVRCNVPHVPRLANRAAVSCTAY